MIKVVLKKKTREFDMDERKNVVIKNFSIEYHAKVKRWAKDNGYMVYKAYEVLLDRAFEEDKKEQ